MAKKKKKKKKPAKSTPASAAGHRVLFETSEGEFTVELFPDAPVTTRNFMELVEAGFYDGLTFHRHVPGFVLQGGDPRGDGTGGSGKTIPLEITGHKHVQGALGMARSMDPNSASSQFYICLADAPHLDGSYAVFGRVPEGMEVVLRLRQGGRMNKVTVAK